MYYKYIAMINFKMIKIIINLLVKTYNKTLYNLRKGFENILMNKKKEKIN